MAVAVFSPWWARPRGNWIDNTCEWGATWDGIYIIFRRTAFLRDRGLRVVLSAGYAGSNISRITIAIQVHLPGGDGGGAVAAPTFGTVVGAGGHVVTGQVVSGEGGHLPVAKTAAAVGTSVTAAQSWLTRVQGAGRMGRMGGLSTAFLEEEFNAAAAMLSSDVAAMDGTSSTLTRPVLVSLGEELMRACQGAGVEWPAAAYGGMITACLPGAASVRPTTMVQVVPVVQDDGM